MVMGLRYSSGQEAGVVDEQKDSVSILSWQYCFGCKETVTLYSKLAAQELERMRKSGEKSSSLLEANRLAENMCDHPAINYKYQPFVKFSCIKLLNEHQKDFMEAFAGHATMVSFQNKADMFHRKRKVSEI